MSKPLAAINIIWAIGDVIVCSIAILAFAWGAWNFEHWGILLFNIIPLALFTNHSLVINADLEAAKEEDIECMKPHEGDHGYER